MESKEEETSDEKQERDRMERIERKEEKEELKCEDNDSKAAAMKSDEVESQIEKSETSSTIADTVEAPHGDVRSEAKTPDEEDQQEKSVEEAAEKNTPGKDSASSEYDFDSSLAEDQMISPASSRRKQTTPTKKPESCQSTVLITHGGQQPPPSPTRARKPRKASDESQQKQKESKKDPTEPVVKKKRGRPFKIKPNESDSDSPQKPKTPRKTPKKNSSFAVPKSSPTIQRLEGEEAPQRRRSKGEMKEFPLGDSIPAVPAINKPTEDTGEVFDKVENDLKGTFAGMSDSADESKEVKTDSTVQSTPCKPTESAKKKRGRKAKVETDIASPSPAAAGGEKKEMKAPGRERSKRQSAQTACLKLHETSDEEEFYFSKQDSKSSRTDGKEDNTEEKASEDSKSGLVTSVERPRKLVKKEMRESLLGDERNPGVSECPGTESDKEQEEKRVELIKSMMKSIESTPPKKGRKRKSKTSQNDSQEVEIDIKTEKPEKVSDEEVKSEGSDKRSTRSRRSRTSEDSPATTPAPVLTAEQPDNKPSSSNNTDSLRASTVEQKKAENPSVSTESPKPKAKRGRKPKKSIEAPDKVNDQKKKKAKITTEEVKKAALGSDNSSEVSNSAGEVTETAAPAAVTSSEEVQAQSSPGDEPAASTKKVDIKLKKVDVSTEEENNDTDKTPVKKGRKRKSVEAADDSKGTPEKIGMRASRRTRGTKSEESSQSLTEDKETVSQAAVEISEREQNTVKDKQDIETEATVNNLADKKTSQPETEKSPKKRGRKPGSRNKPKTPKVQDENVDTSNKQKKKKHRSNVNVLWEKFKGPFIHIDGSFRSPNFVTVVNSTSDSLKPSTIK